MVVSVPLRPLPAQSTPAPRACAFVVFARPDDGPAVSRSAAHRRFDATVALARSLRHHADVIVASDAAGRARLPSGVAGLPQRGSGFEARFLNALDDAFARGYERVVIIGSDTPSLTRADLHRACKRRDRVLGPSADGGVYLLGLDREARPALVNLDWCTSRLGRQLRAALGAVTWLPLRRDVDRPIDLFLTPTEADLPIRMPPLVPSQRPRAGLHGSSMAVFGRGPPRASA